MVTVLNLLVELVILQQQHAVVVGVSEENAGEARRNDTADPSHLHGLGGHLTGGAAAEIRAGDDDVALLDLSRQIRIQRLEDMFDHLFHRKTEDLGRRN